MYPETSSDPLVLQYGKKKKGNGNNTIFMPNPSLMDIGGSFVALDSDFGGNLQQVLQTRLVGFTQPSVSLTGCRLLGDCPVFTGRFLRL
jgi:hypothetical protein